MLRVGLAGDLGSGKSTVAAMLAERGATVFSSDALAASLMEPGQDVYAAIVAQFGSSVVLPDGRLDRRRLAHLAFDPVAPRVAELNEIVHPAVIKAQALQMDALEGSASIVVVESALIFTALPGPGQTWRQRFDQVILVTASEDCKISRFVERSLARSGQSAANTETRDLVAEAKRMLAFQANEQHSTECLLISNDRTLEDLARQVQGLWSELRRLEVLKRATGIPQ